MRRRVYTIKYKVSASESWKLLTPCKRDEKVFVGSELCRLCLYFNGISVKYKYVSCSYKG